MIVAKAIILRINLSISTPPKILALRHTGTVNCITGTGGILMHSNKCLCTNEEPTISVEGITRRFKSGDEQIVCLSRTVANDIAEGGVIAAATYVGSLGGGLTAALLVQLT